MAPRGSNCASVPSPYPEAVKAMAAAARDEVAALKAELAAAKDPVGAPTSYDAAPGEDGPAPKPRKK